LAGSRRPSFLKRQKEQKRLARAAEKREARKARSRAKAERQTTGNGIEMPPDDTGIFNEAMDAPEAAPEEVPTEEE
jgi:hypothetical protein